LNRSWMQHWMRCLRCSNRCIQAQQQQQQEAVRQQGVV
jgi:hypothetical protein